MLYTTELGNVEGSKVHNSQLRHSDAVSMFNTVLLVLQTAW
jgi:hypothetical protein